MINPISTFLASFVLIMLCVGYTPEHASIAFIVSIIIGYLTHVIIEENKNS